MSRDRWIRFPSMPDRAEVIKLVEGFFGSAASLTETTFEYIELHDNFSHHLRYVTNGPTWAEPISQEEKPRCIELHYNTDDRTISVLTRSADAFTGALADGLALRISEWFEGTIDEEA